MSITRRPAVIDDLINLAYYIAQDDLAAADRFLDACDETFHELEQMPGLGRVREFRNPALKDIRMWFVKGFKHHLIFYRLTNTGIEIIRVLHGARDLEHIFDEEV